MLAGGYLSMPKNMNLNILFCWENVNLVNMEKFFLHRNNTRWITMMMVSREKNSESS